MRCSIWLLEDQFGSSMLDVAMGDATGVKAGERNDGKNDVSVIRRARCWTWMEWNTSFDHRPVAHRQLLFHLSFFYPSTC
jgi:hypothetical protein